MDKKTEVLQLEEVLTLLDEKDLQTLELARTAKASEFLRSILKQMAADGKEKLLLTDGVECEVLKIGGTGWLKGKVKMRLEFYPDEAE